MGTATSREIERSDLANLAEGGDSAFPTATKDLGEFGVMLVWEGGLHERSMH
jgi:hypothetical protein